MGGAEDVLRGSSDVIDERADTVGLSRQDCAESDPSVVGVGSGEGEVVLLVCTTAFRFC